MTRSRSIPRVATIALLLAAAACGGGGGASLGGSGLNTAQTVLDLTDAVSALQQREAEMQGQIDSLQRMVARQDTLMTRLAAAAGIAPPPTGYTP